MNEVRAQSALVVLGMHRSGTSAVTGALSVSGAWVGEDAELTGASVENPRGFWERRDIRDICDQLLHSAGADWWKVSGFDPAAIPHAVLAEQCRRFRNTVSDLGRHENWIIKEPRFCLLLPVLRDYLTDPVCIHVVRNPLEVARSLRQRNGFSIPAGIALWEVYNRSALSACADLPRVLVRFDALMLHTAETIKTLVTELAALRGADPFRVDQDRIAQFLDPALYRRRATEDETLEYLTASQRILWSQLRETGDAEPIPGGAMSQVTRQHLYDLESTQLSLVRCQDSLSRSQDSLRHYQFVAKKSQRWTAETAVELLNLRIRIRELDNCARESQKTIRGQEGTIRNLNTKIRNITRSKSWRITAPMRVAATRVRWLIRNLRRVAFLLYLLGTGQVPRAMRAVFPYYLKYVPRSFDRFIPGPLREYARLAISVSNVSSTHGSEQVTPSRLKARVREAEDALESWRLLDAYGHWKALYREFHDDEAISGRAKLELSAIHRLHNLGQYKERIQDYVKARGMHTGADRKVVVYTCIVGSYDTVKLPEYPEFDTDYVLFTDSGASGAGIWKIRPTTYFGSDPTRTARFVKTHPHLLLAEYDVAIWIDANIQILGDISPMVENFLRSGHAVGCVLHPARKTIYEEYIICKNRKKDDGDVMQRQIDAYRVEGYDHEDLIETNFLMFDLKNKHLSEFLNRWWREIDAHSKRDQLSINYAFWKTDMRWHRLMEPPYSVRNHENFAFVRHDGGTGTSKKLVEALEAEVVDPYSGPPYAQIKCARIRGQKERTVDVIVCVHDALEYVRQCLESVLKWRAADRHRLLIVDDGSQSDTAGYLKELAENATNCDLVRFPEARGYTRAANSGLAASSGEFVVLLNSDTVVTRNWTEKLMDAVFETPGAGIVGPLSNAASYQSIPEYRGSGDQTAVNDLPEGMTYEDMNERCEQWTRGAVVPRVPLIHGFCFGVARRVIEEIGYFDERRYPKGYGEENDYCLRASEAGFGLVVATHTYVFHAKSKSYENSARVALMRAASRTFRETYGHARIRRAEIAMADNAILENIRERARGMYGTGN